MIREAELFLLADRAALDAVNRVGVNDWGAILPPLFDMAGADEPSTLRAAVEHYAYDDAWVPDMLASRTMDDVGRETFDGDLLGTDPSRAIEVIVASAAAAAREVTDRDAPVHCSYGEAPTWHYLWQLNIARTVLAHDVAMCLGVRSPLPTSCAAACGRARNPMPISGGRWASTVLVSRCRTMRRGSRGISR